MSQGDISFNCKEIHSVFLPILLAELDRRFGLEIHGILKSFDGLDASSDCYMKAESFKPLLEKFKNLEIEPEILTKESRKVSLAAKKGISISFENFENLSKLYRLKACIDLILNSTDSKICRSKRGGFYMLTN